MLQKIVVVFVCLLSLAACSTAPLEVNAVMVNSVPLKNAAQHDNNVFSGGQPSEVDLEIFADAGVQHIVSLRPSSEHDMNEQAVVEKYDMQFHQIAVAGPSDITTENASRLASLLASFNGEPTVVHCASGNRVGALVAVHAGVNGKSVDEAIAEGKEWGLSSLEPRVREVLAQ